MAAVISMWLCRGGVGGGGRIHWLLECILLHDGGRHPSSLLLILSIIAMATFHGNRPILAPFFSVSPASPRRLHLFILSTLAGIESLESPAIKTN